MREATHLVLNMLPTFVRGIVLAFLYNWFIATPFKIQTFNVMQGIGLGLLIYVATYQGDDTPVKSEDPELTKKIFNHAWFTTFESLFVLFIGYLLSSFV